MKTNVFERKLVKREIHDGLPDLSYSGAMDLTQMVESYNAAIIKYGPSIFLEVETDYDSVEWKYFYMDVENDKEYNARIAAYHRDLERRKKKLEQKKHDAKKQQEEAERLLLKLAEEQGYELVKK